MKKILLVLTAALLLNGCEQKNNTETPSSESASSTVDFFQVGGIYLIPGFGVQNSPVRVAIEKISGDGIYGKVELSKAEIGFDVDLTGIAGAQSGMKNGMKVYIRKNAIIGAIRIK